MKFRWIEPLYGFAPDLEHVAVPASAERILLKMADELVGTDDLVAIYIPEGTDEAWEADSMRGRVVGAVRLLEMPKGKEINDYPHRDLDGSLRWPIGWPCEVVYAPPVELCPVLRSEVEYVFNQEAFKPYVARFQHGPFPLEKRMAAWLERRFSEFEKLV